MFQYLEKLRSKPEGERRKAVIFMSLGITSVIAVIWLITITFRIDSTNFSFDTSTNDKKTPSLAETFSGFVDQVSRIINNSSTYKSPTSTETLVQ